MKRITFTIAVLSLFISYIEGQKSVTIVAKGETTLESALPADMLYAFEEFTDARLLMKDGSENQTRININLVTNDILFLTRGNQILVLAYPDQVERIVMGESVWVPVDGTFGERLAEADGKSLVRVRQTRITDTRKEGGFGFASSTASVTSMTSYISEGNLVGVPLAVGEYDFETADTYRIVAGKKTFTADARGFSKAFGDRKKEIDNYLRSNQVDFKNEEEVIGFMKRCIEM
ncbi:MAG: hypothetical protein RBS37_04935 [Bacteroidales bacterium]|jgi:hypothetical protein|nr:hypothetical protein [Bacteroidales bacterium]